MARYEFTTHFRRTAIQDNRLARVRVSNAPGAAGS